MKRDDESRIIKPADWTISDKYTPLEPLDEFMVHNSPQPNAVSYTTDLRAYERQWFVVQSLGGDLVLMAGIGFYPNLQTADAHAQVNYKGQLSYIHAHRALGNNRMNMKVGPINFEVVEPFKEWRLTLEGNKFGITFDLRWFDTKRPEFGIKSLEDFTGKVQKLPPEPTSGYEGFGCVEGWVEYHGEKLHLNANTSTGSRDHHWGIRDGVGGPARSRKGSGQMANHPLGGQWVEFKDWSIWGWSDLPNVGSDRKVEKFQLNTDYRLKFDDQTKLFIEGIITNHRVSGEDVKMHYRQIGNQIAYLRCGCYGTREGGTPDGDLWWGADVGDHIGGGVYDTNKPENRILLSGGNEHLCEVSCGNETTLGFLELWEPIAYEVCRDNLLPNYTFLEGADNE